MNREIERRIEAAKSAVTAQIELLHREFRRAQSTWKHDGTRVTTADLAISGAILRELAARFPEDQGFSEETEVLARPVAATTRFCWVLDPIDGTNNYAAGIPFCAISLALLEQGVPVYGVIYDLARRTLIDGGPGLGAFDGGEAARVRPEGPQSGSLIGFHSPYDKALVAQAAPIIE